MTTDSLYIRHRGFLGISVSFVLAFLTTPMLVHAQMDVATYNKERHQLINYHTNSQGNLESISIVDDDMTTIMLNVDGTTRSIVNIWLSDATTCQRMRSQNFQRNCKSRSVVCDCAICCKLVPMDERSK